MRAMLVAGPGAVARVGNGVEAHYPRVSASTTTRWDGTHGLLDVRVRLAGREARGTEVLGLGRGDDVRAVGEAVHVLAERRDGGEDELEVLLQLRLVVHERLPLAGRARVTRDQVVALQADLARKSRLDFTLVSTSSWEARAAQLSFNKELSVKGERGRVEWGSGNCGVNVVSGSHGVRGKESNNFIRRESGISHAGENLANII